jgi:pilus assembly protein Flp/PilA
MFKKFFSDDRGATAIEYGLIAAAMGVCLVTVMPYIETALSTQFSSLGTHISTGK